MSCRQLDLEEDKMPTIRNILPTIERAQPIKSADLQSLTIAVAKLESAINGVPDVARLRRSHANLLAVAKTALSILDEYPRWQALITQLESVVAHAEEV
jgi:hypothetical protein